MSLRPRIIPIIGAMLLSLIAALKPGAFIQDAGPSRGGEGAPAAPATLGIDQGFLEFSTPDFSLKLVKASQTVAALEPKGTDGFDFTPADRLESRASHGFYHLGNLTLRLRAGDSDSWQNISTATSRKPVTPVKVSSPAAGRRNTVHSLSPPAH